MGTSGDDILSKSMGRNTVTSEILIEMTVNRTSALPSNVAAKGVMPASIWRETFSSTRRHIIYDKPVAMVNAISGKLSRNDSRIKYTTPKVPSSDTGTATLGMKLA